MRPPPASVLLSTLPHARLFPCGYLLWVSFWPPSVRTIVMASKAPWSPRIISLLVLSSRALQRPLSLSSHARTPGFTASGLCGLRFTPCCTEGVKAEQGRGQLTGRCMCLDHTFREPVGVAQAQLKGLLPLEGHTPESPVGPALTPWGRWRVQPALSPGEAGGSQRKARKEAKMDWPWSPLSGIQ